MELTLSTSLLISLGTLLASATSAFAIVKTKVARLESELEEAKLEVTRLKDELQHYREDERVRIAIIESNQEAHAKELDEIKTDIKTTMKDVQAIKEAVLAKITLKKGEL